MPTRVDNEIMACLIQKFGELNVRPEWDVAKDSQDAFNRRDYNLPPYCPRIDFAVGPFNIDAHLGVNNRLMTEKYNENRVFFEEVHRLNTESYFPLIPNPNPRCFIAVEVEKSGSRKHRIGSIINASAIGKVGILVAFDDANYRVLNRARRYLDFIKRARKAESSPQNVLIVRRSDFLRLFES